MSWGPLFLRCSQVRSTQSALPKSEPPTVLSRKARPSFRAFVSLPAKGGTLLGWESPLCTWHIPVLLRSKKAVCPFLSRKKGRKNAGSSTGGAFTLGITGSEALAPALDVRDCPFSGAVPVSVFKRNHGPSLSVPVAIAFACCPLLGGNRQGTFFALNCRKWPFCPGLLPNAFI